jgi:hypothetical protein
VILFLLVAFAQPNLLIATEGRASFGWNVWFRIFHVEYWELQQEQNNSAIATFAG